MARADGGTGAIERSRSPTRIVRDRPRWGGIEPGTGTFGNAIGSEWHFNTGFRGAGMLMHGPPELGRISTAEGRARSSRGCLQNIEYIQSVGQLAPNHPGQSDWGHSQPASKKSLDLGQFRLQESSKVMSSPRESIVASCPRSRAVVASSGVGVIRLASVLVLSSGAAAV